MILKKIIKKLYISRNFKVFHLTYIIILNRRNSEGQLNFPRSIQGTEIRFEIIKMLLIVNN